MIGLKEVIADLTAECDELDALVADLDDSRWDEETPAPGWTIKHQIGHLSFVFRIAGLAASEPETFKAVTSGAGADFNGAVNAALAEYLRLTPTELLDRWRKERGACIEALAAAPPERPVPWLVRPLPPAVLACAGLMETFAHGQDVRDALGVTRTAHERLRHVCGFAALTWEFGYQARGLTPPATAFRYELTGPSGETWAFGPEDAEQRITGPALDFCLLVTRRRHRDDLAVTATGADADQWLDIAQAYRGPAGPGRRPGQFASRTA
ncbi:TIGR03084 family metal-binding protein [Streptosporangium sp. NPDC050855]|uniref:TIGR03084 family metal-binding protein n=1 Tax=Streptosporangium sp. NPDC050855 TaxID=3366194 RepID=UPI0037884C4E